MVTLYRVSSTAIPGSSYTGRTSAPGIDSCHKKNAPLMNPSACIKALLVNIAK